MIRDDNLRQRGRRKLLRVTMPDGTVICNKSVTQTLVDALAAIGSENFGRITTENCHLPLLSKEVYPRFKEYMKPVADGWYVNTQSDTGQKYMQLISIKKQLGMEDMKVEIGTDFAVSDKKIEMPFRKKNQKLRVTFPDGEQISEVNPLDTFTKVIQKLGVDRIFYKELEFSGKPLITSTNKYQRQVEVENGRWLNIPPTTKEKYKALDLINSILKAQMRVDFFIEDSSAAAVADKYGRLKAGRPSQFHAPLTASPEEEEKPTWADNMTADLDEEPVNIEELALADEQQADADDKPTEKEIVVNIVDPEELYADYPEWKGHSTEENTLPYIQQLKAERREEAKAQREKRKKSKKKAKEPDSQLEIIFSD